MRKLIKPLLAGAGLVVYLVVCAPHLLSLYSSYGYYKELGQNLEEMKENNAVVDVALSEYQEKYQDVRVSSNFDIAKTVAGIAGAEFVSVTALVDRDGQMFECSEVTSVDDVNFFNDIIEYMSFSLKLVDARKFITALNSSALTVHSLTVNEKEMKAVLVVNAAYQGNGV